MKVVVVAVAAGIAFLGARSPLSPAGVAWADDTDYFGDNAPEDDISFRTDLPRTTKERIVIGALFGGAALFGAGGLYFHLDSRSKSDNVSAAGDHTGLVYDRAIDDERSSALTSRKVAIVSYSVSGAFLVASAVALYLTDPGTKVVTVGQKQLHEGTTSPPDPVVPVSIAPIRGGAMLTGGWSF